MSLYLCVFDGDAELDGVEVGTYADFAALRDYVATEIEGGVAGSRFPVFMMHSDCDGQWSADDCLALREELQTLARSLRERPPRPFSSDWQQAEAAAQSFVARTAYDSFIDVDGELLMDRLQALVELACNRRLPILFQ